MPTPSRLLSLVFAVIFICLTPLAQSAPESGRLLLNVKDATTRRPLDGVAIQLIDREGHSRALRTEADGRLTVDTLPPGLYELRLSLPGYQRLRLPSVRVVADKTTPVETQLLALRQDIEEVLVIGSATADALLSSVGASSIDREALRSAAGSGGDALRALDGLPGVFSDGAFSAFSVRGGSPRDNLILVDGIPFANVVHFGESFGEDNEVEDGGRYSVFAPNLIDSAEFQPGGWSSAYGGRAGSLLKLNVASGNPETPAYSARLDIAGAELGYDGPSRLREDTTVLLSARQYNFGRLFESIGLDDVGTPELTDIVIKTNSRLDDDNTLNLLAIYAPEQFRRDIDNVLASDEDEPGNFEDVELVRFDTDNSLYAVTWSRLIGDDNELRSQIYRRHFRERSDIGEAYPDLVPLGTPAADIPVRDPLLLARREETEWGLQMEYQQANAWGRLVSGLQVRALDLRFNLRLTEDWIRYEYRQEDFRPQPEQRYIVLTPASTDHHYTDSATQYALYADQEFSLGDWELRLGTRYERDNFSDADLVGPRFGATWLATNDWRISTTAGRYFQAPRFNDRASDANNADLENAVVDQFSLGFAYALAEDIELFVEPYYQELNNLVVKGDDVERRYSNSGEGKSYGVDTAISRQFEGGWSLNAKYSYNEARVRDQRDAEEYDAEFSRPHSFSVGGLWEINERWKISARWKWASGKTRDAFVIYDNVLGDGEALRFAKEITEDNVDRYANFNSLNFRVDYRRAFGRTNIVAFVDVINALGADNPSSSDFNERSGEDVVEDGEALPLLGLRLEW